MASFTVGLVVGWTRREEGLAGNPVVLWLVGHVRSSSLPGKREGLDVRHVLHGLDHAFLDAEPGILDAPEG